MKIFFDMEFTGLHQGTTPISLGAISEDGRVFYAEFIDYCQGQIDNWIFENVIKNLVFLGKETYSSFVRRPGSDLWKDYDIELQGTKEQVAYELKQWLAQFDQVEMWGDCLAYDWVLFCELFGGGAECLPKNVYYIPFDICTLFKVKGIDPDISRIEYSGLEAVKHNALDDAKVIRACYNKAIQ